MNISQLLTKLKTLVYSKSETDSLLGGKASSSHTHTKSQIIDFPSLATVATSGSYSDLSNKPTSMTPSSHSHGNITNAGAIGTTANKPLITTTNGAITTGSFGTTANTFCQGNDSRLSDARTPTSHTHTKSQITDFPTIPTKTSQLSNDSGFLTSHQSLSNYSTLANTVKSLSISGKTITVTPGSGNAYTLTTQDTNTTYSNFVKSGSGAAAGLVPAPSTTAGTTKYLREDGTWQVPPDHTYTVNNATLTIQKNGTNVATFTANASSNVTANITVPTKTSQLTNDSSFITGVSWGNVSSRPYMVDSIYYKSINGSFSTQYRTQTKGNTTKNAYLSVIRTDTGGVSKCPTYGSGIASGMADTHFYIYCSYSSAEAYIGGGNADKLNWISRINVEDATYLNGYRVYVG